MRVLSGWKTYIAAGTAVVVGAALVYVGQGTEGLAFINGGLGLLGLGHKADKLIAALEALRAAGVVEKGKPPLPPTP